MCWLYVLESTALVIVAERIKHHALLGRALLLVLAPGLLPAVAHGAVAADEDDLLVLGAVAAVLDLDLGLLAGAALVDEELADGFLEGAHPGLDGGGLLGAHKQLAGNAPGYGVVAERLGLLLLAEGGGGLLGFDVGTDAHVPGGGDLVRDVVDRMRGPGLPIKGLGWLRVGDVHETIYNCRAKRGI